jgi:zinc/manganese transport system ATP-binding protein
MAIIEFKEVTLKVSQRPILTEFNASIEPGEFIGIFGANGARKTTLLRAILGLLKPTSGKIVVFHKMAQRGHCAIGFMPQINMSSQTMNRLSGKERLAAALNGFNWGLPYLNKQQRIEIDKAIDLVGAEKYANQPYIQLSGGEKQRLALAQALLSQPQVLLLDEPLNMLDPSQQQKMLALISSLQQEYKMTVLLTAHDFNPLIHIMTRILYLAAGKAAIGTVDDIVTSDQLSALYDTPIEVIKHNQRLFVIYPQALTNYLCQHSSTQ